MSDLPERVAPLDAVPASGGASLAIIGGSRVAGVLMDPTRQRILRELRRPGSATTLSAELGLSRQLANYHVRALERVGLVEEVGRRRRRGLEERIVRATATHYLIAPDALRQAGEAPDDQADRFSASYQVATAARTIREVAELAERSRAAGSRLTTLTIDTEVRFASPAEREAFGNELLQLVAALVSRYHAPAAPDGRRYRLFAGAHPKWEVKEEAETP
jgi:DNA-binding transcriptional ArsR family regulator